MSTFVHGQKVRCISTDQTERAWNDPGLPEIGKEYTVDKCWERTTGEVVEFEEDHTYHFCVEDFELIEQISSNTFEDYDRAMGIIR